MEGTREFVADELWLLIGVVTFAATGLAGIAGFDTLVPAIAVIGWFLLAPIFLFWGEEIAAAVFDEPGADAREAGRKRDAVEELKRRYAEGEIDDAEFERRLDRLLAVDDALDRAFTDSGHREQTPSGNGPPAAQHGPATDAPAADDEERDPEFES